MKPIGLLFDAIERFSKNTADIITPNEARKAVGLEPLEDVQSAELSESRREHYEPLICSRCGGQIDRETMKCLYCLTEYGTTKNTVKVYSDDRVIAEFDVPNLGPPISLKQ